MNRITPARPFAKPFQDFPRPTRFGWTYLGFVLTTLLGCINYQLSLGYFISFLLGSLWLVAAVEARRQLQGISLTLLEPDQVFAGHHADLQLQVHNASSFARTGFRVRLGLTTLVMNLPPLDSATGQIRLLAPVRGWMPLPLVQLEGMDPLGLFSLTRTEKAVVEALLVYPAPEAAPPMWPTQGTQQTASVRRRAGTEEYRGLRPYQRGDLRGQIAWKRGELPDGSLLVKELESPQGTLATFDWRTISGQLDTEARVSRLTAWVLGAERQGVAYHLVLPGMLDSTGTGSLHAQKCLTALAIYHAPGQTAEQVRPPGGKA